MCEYPLRGRGTDNDTGRYEGGNARENTNGRLGETFSTFMRRVFLCYTPPRPIDPGRFRFSAFAISPSIAILIRSLAGIPPPPDPRRSAVQATPLSRVHLSPRKRVPFGPPSSRKIVKSSNRRAVKRGRDCDFHGELNASLRLDDAC